MMAEAPRRLSPEQAQRQRRRSVALAVLLAVLALLFYILAVVKGPGTIDRPI